MTTVEDIRKAALRLGSSERAELATILIRSLDAPGEEISDEEWREAWGKEIARRIAAYEAGETTAVDWRESIAEARRQLEKERQT